MNFSFSFVVPELHNKPNKATFNAIEQKGWVFKTMIAIICDTLQKLHESLIHFMEDILIYSLFQFFNIFKEWTFQHCKFNKKVIKVQKLTHMKGTSTIFMAICIVWGFKRFGNKKEVEFLDPFKNILNYLTSSQMHTLGHWSF
jgi:hypothetical protein